MEVTLAERPAVNAVDGVCVSNMQGWVRMQ